MGLGFCGCGWGDDDDGAFATTGDDPRFGIDGDEPRSVAGAGAALDAFDVLAGFGREPVLETFCGAPLFGDERACKRYPHTPQNRAFGSSDELHDGQFIPAEFSQKSSASARTFTRISG